MQVGVWTGAVLSDTSEVVVQLEREDATCGELLKEVLLASELSPSSTRRGAWQLEEDWHGCSKI